MAKKKTITGELRELEIGQFAEFPAEQSTSLRSISSMLGFSMNRIYKTESDRERRVIVVTRTA